MENNSIQKGTEKVRSVKRKSIVREYTEAILIALFLALIIRTFIVQAFKIPSGSMKNTLLIPLVYQRLGEKVSDEKSPEINWKNFLLKNL